MESLEKNIRKDLQIKKELPEKKPDLPTTGLSQMDDSLPMAIDKKILDDQQKANDIRKEIGIPEQKILENKTADEQQIEPITPETAKKMKWYSSNTSVGEKMTPDGKKIYGLSLTTNQEYAQSYSKTKQINVFDLSAAKLKQVSFNYGMTVDSNKKEEILSQGFDGIIFEGMGGPEIALLNDVAHLEDQITPIPKWIHEMIASNKALPEKIVNDYKINMPEGYELEDGRYVFKKSIR